MMAEGPDPIEELLGAYALGALEDHERRQVEVFLANNPRARAEVAAHQEAAAMLAFSGERPPVGLWDRIAASLDEPAPEPGPELAAVIGPPRRSRRRSWRTIGGAAAVAVAAAAVAVAVTSLVVRNDDVSGPPTGDVVQWAYGEAWANPAARRSHLVSDDTTLAADVVIEPTGTGFLSAKGLPALADTETYQLWGVYADGDVISLGVIGNRPGVEAFTARGDLQSIVITREAAGGVMSSTSGALVAGQLA